MSQESDMTDWNEFNRTVIDEFRETGGTVGGAFAGAPMILITHRGAKTGTEYTTPLVHTRDGDDYVVIASKGGAPEDPQWFRNLVANPDITVEIGSERFPARARVAEGEERARLFRAQADLMPNFDDYARATSREIPVVVIERA
jgi:deazaflavin-dependent oxidoreductase (nitroreductase family)